MNQHIYNIKYIPGTSEYVIKELENKFPNILTTVISDDIIEIQTPNENIVDFQYLLSAISITNSQNYNLQLHKRSWRTKNLPASTNPPLAYILCEMANLNPKDILYDPFCGAGTIPITAITNFKIKKAFASDVSGNAIDNVESNKKSANITDKKLVTFRSNISMTKLKPQTITKIISNLPFGIRTGSHEKNIEIYQNLSQKAKKLLTKDGIGIFLTQEKKLFEKVFNKDFKIKIITTVDIGGLTPNIYKINPR